VTNWCNLHKIPGGGVLVLDSRPRWGFPGLPLTVMVKTLVLEPFPETQLLAQLMSSGNVGDRPTALSRKSFDPCNFDTSFSLFSYILQT
jgi:hypothetical protein